MMIHKIKAVENLMQLGFTARQANFFYLVGTQTGVFNLAQYRVFADVNLGAASMTLLRRLESLKYITRLGITYRQHVIHIDHKAFYRAILDKDSRLRRDMSPSLMRRRLHYLDYIVRNPHLKYLPTETAKQEALTFQFGLSEEMLPQQIYTSKSGENTTTRFFPERFPMFLEEASDDISLGIIYGEDPANQFRSFKKFVFANREFLTSIPSLYFVYVSPRACFINTWAA